MVSIGFLQLRQRSFTISERQVDGELSQYRINLTRESLPPGTVVSPDFDEFPDGNIVTTDYVDRGY